jgi:hypothetical protein
LHLRCKTFITGLVNNKNYRILGPIFGPHEVVY